MREGHLGPPSGELGGPRQRGHHGRRVAGAAEPVRDEAGIGRSCPPALAGSARAARDRPRLPLRRGRRRPRGDPRRRRARASVRRDPHPRAGFWRPRLAPAPPSPLARTSPPTSATTCGLLPRRRHLQDRNRGRSRRVVDATGAVQGLERLYVCDASIIPTIPRANTNLTTVALAERIADLAQLDRLRHDEPVPRPTAPTPASKRNMSPLRSAAMSESDTPARKTPRVTPLAAKHPRPSCPVSTCPHSGVGTCPKRT